MKFNQDLCLNFGKLNSTLGSVVPLAMFSLCHHRHRCRCHQNPTNQFWSFVDESQPSYHGSPQKKDMTYKGHIPPPLLNQVPPFDN